MTDKKYRDIYIKNGICISCGSRPVWEGLVRCKICHKENKDICARKKKLKSVLGICYNCSKKAVCGVLCDYHWKMRKVQDKKERARRKTLNLCIRCGKPKSDEIDINFETGKFFSTCHNCRKHEFAGRKSFNLR